MKARPDESRRLLLLLFLTTLLCTPLVAYTATRTWDGDGTNSFWTNPTNWVGDVAPVAGDDLFFPVAPPNLLPVNNFPAGTTFNSLIFAGGGYTIGGSSIALNAGIFATNGANNFINNPLVLNSNQTFTLKAGSTSFSLLTAIITNGKELTWDIGSGTLAQVQAVISGAGGLVKTGVGSVLLYASNTFSGPVQVLQGALSIYGDRALGDTNGVTTVSNGALLTLANAITVSESLVLSGTLSSAGLGQTWTGALALAGTNPTIRVVTGASLTVNTVISGAAGLTKTLPGILTLNSNNTYTGTTTVTDGTLRVNGLQPTSPIVLQPGELGGTGTVGTVAFAFVILGSSTLAPGSGGPGILTCSNITFGGTTFAVELNGTTPGSNYDQLNVHGTVTLENALLSVTPGYTPAPGDSFVIIANDGSDPVNGTFKNLPQGSTFTNSGADFSILYNGGDGNDVVLYRGYPPLRLTAITASPNGASQIQGLGLSNQIYTIQAASNLNPVILWSNIGTATGGLNGNFTFTDTNAPFFPMRFYRALSP